MLTGAEEQKEERAVNFYSSQIDTSNNSTPSPTVRERAFIMLMSDVKNVIHAIKPPTLIDVSYAKKVAKSLVRSCLSNKNLIKQKLFWNLVESHKLPSVTGP